jgi:hypothetical protein
VKLLSRRYPEATQAAREGDPVGFVQGLKQRGYFTGDPAAYTRSVVSLSGIAPSYGGAASPPPVLDAAPVRRAEAPLELASNVSIGAPSGVPIVDALALADEISRAALRIAAESHPKGRRG